MKKAILFSTGHYTAFISPVPSFQRDEGNLYKVQKTAEEFSGESAVNVRRQSARKRKPWRSTVLHSKRERQNKEMASFKREVRYSCYW